MHARFGQQVLGFSDPHGLHVALVETPAGRPFTPWATSDVPVAQQIRGLRGAQIWERNATATKQFLTTVLGVEELATEGGWTRFGFRGSAGVVDVRDAPEARRGEVPPDPTTKKCPECLSEIPIGARRCAFCTSLIPM